MRSKILLGPLLLLGQLAAFAPALAQAPGGTLGQVRARGELICGTNPGLPGFAQRDAAGVMRGLDADTCRAVAAAVLGDASKVRFVPVATPEAPAALRDGRVDVVARNMTQTMSRDVDLGLSPAGINFYDGQGFLVPLAGRIEAIAALDGKRVCVHPGTSNEVALADAARRNGITVTPVPLTGLVATAEAYAAGRCDAVTGDVSFLLVLRQTRIADPAAHQVLPDIISREPLGPLVRDGDARWRSIVTWVVNAMLEAEALEVTSANAAARRSEPGMRIRRFLGAEPGLGSPLGLADDWAFRVVTEVGNYAEVFERSLGGDSPFKLSRGLNALWFRGGLMYPIPMR